MQQDALMEDTHYLKMTVLSMYIFDDSLNLN